MLKRDKMLAELITSILALLFSFVMFFKFLKSKDIRKGVMSFLFFTGFISSFSSLLYYHGFTGLECFKMFSSVVIPAGLVIIALMFLTRLTNGLLFLLAVITAASAFLAFKDYYNLMVVLSLASAVLAIVMFSFILLKTKSRRMLLFLSSIILFTIGPVMVSLGASRQVHYFFIIIGLLILFYIFNK